MAQHLAVEGMACDGCEENVKAALSDVAGVTNVDVDHTTDSASVEGDPDVDSLIEAVENAGYLATTA